MQPRPASPRPDTDTPPADAAQPNRPSNPWLPSLLLGVPLYALVMTCFLEECSQSKPVAVWRFLTGQPINAALNLSLIMLLAWFCVGLTGRLLAGLGLAALPLILIGVTNRLKQDFLFDPFFPSDLALWNDFLSVGINFVKSWQILLIPLALSMPLAGWLLDRRLRRPPLARWRRVTACLLCGALLVAIAISPGTPVAPALSALGMPADVPLSRIGYRKAGLLLAFTLNIKTDEARLAPPDRYGPQAVQLVSQELLHDSEPAVPPGADLMRAVGRDVLAAAAPPTTRPALLPHVVILHAESLFRVQDIPQITLSRDPTPNLQRLWTEAGPLKTLASHYGGGSVYSEFEAATGFSTSIFPMPFNYPYQLVLPRGRPVPTLAWLFRSYGYHTAAIAPYARTLFQVHRLYPLMGYQQHIAREDFTAGDYEDRYIADRVTVNRLLSLLKTADRPTFVFAATMGSHGPYDGCAKNVTDVHVTRATKSDDGVELDGYVRTLSRLDDAMGTLFAGLKTLDRPVVVLLYGDHLPGIREVQKLLLPRDQERLPDEKAKLFTTLAFLWSNPPAAAPPDPRPVQRSIGLFVPMLLRRCGISHPFYTDFLERLARQVPGIGVDLFVTPTGRASFDPPPAAAHSLEMLRMIEYDIFFGDQHCLPTLFPEFTKASADPRGSSPH